MSSRPIPWPHLAIFYFLLYPALLFGQTAPEQFLGFKPGADYHLANYEQAIAYFALLASQSDRMQLLDMGATSAGRRMKYAVISSKENLAKLARYKRINSRLSLVRGVGKTRAERLAEQGKVIVWIDGGLHATEVAPAQHHLQLAYDLITGEDRQTRFIRDNCILLLVFANPDGMTIVSDWYMKNVGTPYEVSPLPELYHKYAGHDNNRDSFISNLVETQNMNRATSQEWFPEILYNQHQTGPFPARIWIPPESEPTNPNVHPLIIRWKNLIGSAMGKAFDEAGQDGAISRISYDSWFPGYVTQIVDGHNIPSILTETQLYRYATPRFYTVNDFSQAHRDLIVGTFYPSPWKGGWWRLGDAVAYNLTASRALLEAAAKYRYEFLYNKWRIGNDVIDRFENEPPYGWIIPADQPDPNTTALMLNRLMILGMEVYTADEPFVHNGIAYTQGSYIVPTSQPFGLFVKNMFEKQQYPDLRNHPHLWQGLVRTVRWDGAPLRPYDGVGWTLPIQMGVEYREISKPLDVQKTLVDSAVPPDGTVSGSGLHYLFSHSDNNSFLAVNRILDAGGRVWVAQDEFNLSGKVYPKGTFIADGESIASNTLGEIAASTHVPMVGDRVNVRSKLLTKPRIALYKSWVASMDGGWISLILERYGFSFHFLTNAEIRAGKLEDRFDVIILPDQRASSIINGHQKGTMPPDYVGGITADGAKNLKAFVEAGGTLVSNKSSNDLAITHFRIPIKNILSGVPREKFSIPGSILRIRFDTSHPLAFGMDQDGTVFFGGGSRAYEIVRPEPEKKSKQTGQGEKKPGQKEAHPKEAHKQKDSQSSSSASKSAKQPLPIVVASYPDEDLLVSGWQLGEEMIRSKAAVLEVPLGKGTVVLFGFNTHNRAQAYSTFKLLFNAIYYGRGKR